MKISMSMLDWYLKDFNTEVFISHDHMNIQRARILPSDQPMDKDCVYLSESKESDAWVLVHEKSIILVKNCDFYEVMNAVLSAFDYFNHWEMRLKSAADTHMPLSQMLDLLEETLCNSIILWTYSEPAMKYTDSREHMVDELWKSSLDQTLPVPELSNNIMIGTDGSVVNQLTKDPQLIRNFNPAGNPVLMSNLYYEKNPIAALTILQGNPRFIELNRQLSSFAGTFLIQSYELSLITAVQKGEEILFDLLNGCIVNQDAVDKLMERLGHSYRLLTISHVKRDDILYKKSLIQRLKNRNSTSVITLYNDLVVSLIPESLYKTGPEKIYAQEDISNMCICISMPGYDLKNIGNQWKQVSFTYRSCKGAKGIFSCEYFAFEWLLGTLSEYPLTPTLIHPIIQTLDHYDRENNGCLRQTLSVYLKTEMNHALTAKRLHIHPNTLKYRLKRIGEIAGTEFRECEDLSYLRLSAWLADLLYMK